MRLSKLERWILTEIESNECITQNYVYKNYYDDTDTIIEEIKTAPWRDKKKMKAQLSSRNKSIRHAFNQLFLKKLVLNEKGETFDGLVKNYIEYAKQRIKSDTKCLAEKDNVFLYFRLRNLEEYLEKAKTTEIMKAKDWSALTGVPSCGGLICVGSEITMLTYPTMIKRK